VDPNVQVSCVSACTVDVDLYAKKSKKSRHEHHKHKRLKDLETAEHLKPGKTYIA